ncbi:protein indeterminate-domain 9-like isoform X2 [Cynara cardunculus var. scolymus]|uniref:protein indeterminate-domain 9-like isoform X2 n=1 Tax=Cynara cardunculus var. scolymus TaxID=59895 RepID=UPI000D62631E|nr:protein indeterminate-domain 9-like isoform X2 [Cynara cardunculus var. scolymus]
MMSGDGFSSPPPSLTALVHDPVTKPNPNSANSAKRKRSLPGTPDAEVIALSPKSLMATNRFMCEICNKGFQRDQNLQLHRRGHNLPWKLKQRNKQEVVRKKVYICPEKSCVHHDPSRALGDLTGVKKHFSRKHGEKKWKCEKCSKKYAVLSDWKAHSKICGTREYKCDCGTLFSRKDSFVTHRAFCDAISEEHSGMASFPMVQTTTNLNFQRDLMMMNGGDRIGNPRLPAIFCGGGELAKSPDGNEMKPRLPIWLHHHANNPLDNSTTNSLFLGSSSSNDNNGGILSSEMVQWLSRSQEAVQTFTELPQGLSLEEEENNKEEMQLNSLYNYGGCPNYPPPPPPHLSATALLQKASQIGSTRSTNSGGFGFMSTTKLSELTSLNQTRNNGGSQAENLRGEMMNGDGLTMMMMAGLNKKTGEGNLTRDFLGVEGYERRAFSLQQELIKFTCSNNDSSIGFSGSQ